MVALVLAPLASGLAQALDRHKLAAELAVAAAPPGLAFEEAEGDVAHSASWGKI
jgi:hypothetical protein